MSKKGSDLYVRFWGPVLEALRALGGTGTPREVKDLVIQACHLSSEELAKTRKSGGNAVENEIHWAREGLKLAGLLDGSERGVWRLTPEGAQTTLTIEEARAIRAKIWRTRNPVLPQVESSPDSGPTVDPEEVEPTNNPIQVLQSLPPHGFERFCQRLLRESGFVEVIVTGKSGDGGIDGYGTLQVNALVSFRVLFQCKRYQGSVTPKEIRDFRGAMTGRTDKGIFLTTGSFTREAEAEAAREGAPAIELVDGNRLVALMESLQLGLMPRTVFDIDHKFFEEYQR